MFGQLRFSFLFFVLAPDPVDGTSTAKPSAKTSGGTSSQNPHVTAWGDYAACDPPPASFCSDYSITDAQVVASLSGFAAASWPPTSVTPTHANYYGDWWQSNVGTNQAVAATYCSPGNPGANQTAVGTAYGGVSHAAVGAGGYSLTARGTSPQAMEDYCSAAAQGRNTPPMIGTTHSSASTYYTQEFTRTPATKSRAVISNMVGWAVDGVVIFSPFTGVGSVAPYDETLDTCGGHPANGRYHYHGFSPCLHGESSTQSGNSIPHSKIYGWAFDGFPIYGPYGYTDGNDVGSAVTRILSGYACTANGAACATDAEKAVSGNWAYDATTNTNTGKLDECNGRWTKTPEFPNGMYVYVLNVQSNGRPDFPGVPYCVHGGVTGTVAGGTTASSSAAEKGFASGYGLGTLLGLVLGALATSWA